MKKIIAVLILFAGVFTAKAQAPAQYTTLYTVAPALDTNINVATSYVYLNSIGSKLKSIQLTVTQISGTVGGTAVIYQSDDGLGWTSTGDTLKMTNVALNTALFPFYGTSAKSYKAAFNTTGNPGECSLQVTAIRRTDE